MAEIRNFKKDELTVRVFDNRVNMGAAAAKEGAAWINEVIREKGEVNIIFAAAPSQNDFLAALIKEDVDWTRVNAFHMDEYIGLSEDAPQGFANFLRRAIFDRVPFKAVYCMNGQNESPEAECKRYEQLLLSHPTDIIFMGIGENGHIAFNDPGVAKFDDPENVKIAKLDEVCRNQQVNDGCFASIDLVPTHAYTLTVPIMMSAPKLMLVVPTALKAKAIHDTVLGPVDEMVPASIVRTHKGGATLYTDEAGASYLIKEKNMSKLFINAKVILPDRIIDGAVRIDGEKITDVYENGYTKKESDELIDVGGLYLSPGFIDVHVHGGGGGYFMSGDEEEIDTVCKTHLRHGTTAFNPTLSAASKEMIINSLAAMDSYDKRAEIRPDFLGYYLEGPYLSPNACGAMPEGHLRLPDPQEYDELLDRFANIVRWGLAPELDGALPLIEKLTRRGVISSVAHSDGYFDDVVKAREAGTNSITHLYSLTPTVRRKNAYRYSGVLEAAYLFDDLFVEVISDGCHLPESLLKLIYKIKGSDRIMIITDAISAAGSDQSDGVQYYSQTGSPIIVEDGVAKLPSREAFAGSIATMDRCVRTMMNLAEVPLCEAVKMASATPARHLGIFDRKGSIEVGKDADLVVFDSDVRVKSVYVRGKRVFN